jgi:hypothetical protein
VDPFQASSNEGRDNLKDLMKDSGMVRMLIDVRSYFIQVLIWLSRVPSLKKVTVSSY